MDIVVSCPNFLRPIYHTLSASQAPKRGHAPRKKPLPATALVFCLIFTDLHSPVMVLICLVDAIPYQVLVDLLQMQSVPDSIIYGFLFQNPVQSPRLRRKTESDFKRTTSDLISESFCQGGAWIFFILLTQILSLLLPE